MNEGEAYFLGLIKCETLSIDNEGRIWRHYSLHRRGENLGKLDEPKRAEVVDHGYLRLFTSKDNKQLSALAHRIVYIHFFGDVIDGLVVDHGDSNRANNNPKNLFPMTGPDNSHKASREGKYRISHGPKGPRKMPVIPKTEEERFWEKVDIRGEDDCWNWLAGKNKHSGHGVFKAVRAKSSHRYSFIINIGEIPEGMSVLHRCDNPLCVNPKHLYLGTQVDNVSDMDKRGRRRSLYGEEHGRAKVPKSEVLRIRRDGIPYGQAGDVARRLGVHISTIYRIVSGSSWRYTHEDHP